MPKKPIYSVAFNDADYDVAKSILVEGKWKQVWMCPAYSTWKKMLERALSKEFKRKFPAYKSVKVCNDWLYFSNFKMWWDENYVEGYHLDKDILVEGNVEYHPEKCLYVPQWLNNFVVAAKSNKGEWPTGVSWNKDRKAFEAYVTLNSVRKNLGCFDNPDDAHEAWRVAKFNAVINRKEDFDSIDERIFPSLLQRYSK